MTQKSTTEHTRRRKPIMAAAAVAASLVAGAAPPTGVVGLPNRGGATDAIDAASAVLAGGWDTHGDRARPAKGIIDSKPR